MTRSPVHHPRRHPAARALRRHRGGTRNRPDPRDRRAPRPAGAWRRARATTSQDTVNYSQIVNYVRGSWRARSSSCSSASPPSCCDGLWDEFDPVLVEVAVSKIAPPVSLPIHAARVEVVRTS